MRYLTSLYERKVNYAISVKFIMPFRVLAENAKLSDYIFINACNSRYLQKKSLDKYRLKGKIRLTVSLSYLGDMYHGRLWRCKTGSTWAKWHFKFPLRGCYRPIIFGKRVFRFPRLSASQVRDASASQRGWTICFGSGKSIRFFPCILLSDTAGIRPTRISRADAASAWSQTCPQVNRRCYVFCFSLQKQRAFLAGDRFGESGKKAVWFKCTPSQYRTSVTTPAKKRAVNFFEPDTCLDHCVERYEQLRRMVLENRDYCCQGWGLALLIHRGFVAWIYAFSKIESSQQESVGDVTSAPDRTCLAIPDTIRSQMIMSISEMVMGTLREVVL